MTQTLRKYDANIGLYRFGSLKNRKDFENLSKLSMILVSTHCMANIFKCKVMTKIVCT